MHCRHTIRLPTILTEEKPFYKGQPQQLRPSQDYVVKQSQRQEPDAFHILLVTASIVRYIARDLRAKMFSQI